MYSAAGRKLLDAFRGTGPVAVSAALIGSVAYASGGVVPPAQYPWSHASVFGAFDAASVRRGHLVYSNVCATCHSLNRIAFRNFVGVIYTEAEAKALAENITVMDGPDDSGEMYERPGKLSDYLPAPYKNEQQARSVNNGALPPDLSLMTKARHDGSNYVFALLTGYREAPVGIDVAAGQYYNPYFPGAKIGMALQLQDGGIEYPDGTPATASQMAKDVTTFLAWAAEPENDERKRMAIKWLVFFFGVVALTGAYKRFRWGPLKNRRIEYRDHK